MILPSFNKLTQKGNMYGHYMQENYTTQFPAGAEMFIHYQIQTSFGNFHRVLRNLSSVLKHSAHETAICQ
jgi:hypothetical protein